MRITWYVLGVLVGVSALSYARDVAGTVAIAGTPTPLSIESMQAIADKGCQRPVGFRSNTVQRLHSGVFEVGVTDKHLVVCTINPQMQGISLVEAGAPASGKYFAGRLGLVGEDETVELGRVAPEVAALEFELPTGQVVKAELHGETYLCRIPPEIFIVKVRAYDASGRLLREAEI